MNTTHNRGNSPEIVKGAGGCWPIAEIQWSSKERVETGSVLSISFSS